MKDLTENTSEYSYEFDIDDYNNLEEEDLTAVISILKLLSEKDLNIVLEKIRYRNTLLAYAITEYIPNKYYWEPESTCNCRSGIPKLKCQNSKRLTGDISWGRVSIHDNGPCQLSMCPLCARKCDTCEKWVCKYCVGKETEQSFECIGCYDGASLYTMVSTGTCDRCAGRDRCREFREWPKSEYIEEDGIYRDYFLDDEVILNGYTCTPSVTEKLIAKTMYLIGNRKDIPVDIINEILVRTIRNVD